MSEGSNAEWDDIQDRLKEKDAEMERLKRDNAFMASNDYVHSLTSEIKRLKASEAHWVDMAAQADVACMGMKSLLTRAADALEAIYHEWPILGPPDPLIDELGKAAE